MSTSTERMRRLRERRAAERDTALAPVPDAPPRDPDELLLPAAEATIAALGLGERDAAAAQVVRLLAAAIDDARDQFAALRYLGPELRKALEAIGGTPAARAKLPQKPPQRSAPSRLAQLRADHQNSPAKRKRAGLAGSSKYRARLARIA
jgi:hypothetical protein